MRRFGVGAVRDERDKAHLPAAPGLWDIRGVIVALPVELARAGEFEPGLEVLGNRLVRQGTLGVARVVEFGFGRCCWLGYSRRAVARMVG